jgi:hypothetical protein
LSRYFGPDQRITDLFDPNQPMIFPESGRLLALGVAVGVLKNITSEKFGHLEQKQIGDPNFGLGIEFYDTVSKAGRLDRRPSIETLSRLLVALSDFKDAIRGDPSIPPAVTDLVPQFQLLIDLGTLYLGAQAQSETGAFDSLVGASDVNSHRLQSQIHGLRALTSAFDLSERAVYQLRLEAGWKFLDRFWRETPDSKERALPVWREQDLPQVRIDAQPIDPSRVWELLNFWEETQLKVRPALEQSGIDWKLWEQRFERIRVRLLAQMRTTEGPARWVVEQ